MATGSSVDSPDAGVRLSTLSPKYLHTNSTSHTWPFSAIAELIDNAYDPDVNASQLWIDVKKYPKHNYCLVFTDYGAGMGPEKLHKMLSFGFCDKVAKKGQHMPVGHYGNGFKSGSMRLGRDAIVFTKNANSKSVGFLSQTYLDAIKAETILVPMVTWDTDGKITPKSDKEKALKDILTYSIFRRKEELLAEFATIQNPSGTRIIIFNVRTTPDGKPEFDFSIDDDIRIPKDTDVAITKLKRQERQNHIPESDYSLRAYCAILYLRPRMQIMLRGKKVRTTVITKSLSKTEVDTYRPSVRENTPVIPANVNKAVKITFGFSQNRNHYGIMMYHRNRLIKPYVRVGYQLRANNLGVGVVGVIECDFLQPTHNKQDFDYTKAYRACIAALGNKLNDYWNEKKGPQRANSKEPIPEPVEVQQGPDQSWVQCDNLGCLKWRKLPDGTDLEKLPDKWYCQDSPYPHMRSCDIPEEKEDEIEQPYVKTQKKRLEKEMEDRKRKEKEAKQNQEEEAKRLEQQRKELEKKEVELDRLKKQLSEMQSTSESAILQSIEVNSTRQQQAIQQQIKGEKKSPQPLRIKVVTQPPSASRSTAGVSVTQSSNLTRNVLATSSSTIKNGPLILPSSNSNQQPTVKVVKVFSSVPAQSHTQAVSGKPLVQIVPNPQGHIARPNHVVADLTTPKVVSVQSLQSASVASGVTSQTPQKKVTVQNLVLQSGHKIHLQTPVSQVGSPVSNRSPQYQVKSVTVQAAQAPQKIQSASNAGVASLISQNQLPSQQTNSPLKSPSLSTIYKPLESLQEVNRQTTQANVVSPVSAVLPEAADTVETSPSEFRNQVTVSDRYRYIVPSPQTTAQVSQLVQTVSAVNSATLQPITPTQSNALQVNIKQEPQRTASSSTDSNIPTTQVHYGAEAAASSTPQPIKIKIEKIDRPQVNGIKRAHEEDSDVIEQPPKQKPRQEREVIIIDDPPSPTIKKNFTPQIRHELDLKDVDNDLITTLRKLSPEEQWIRLAKSAQQLRCLRDDVCKLLRILVPEIELGERAEILDNTTVDDLLKQVLEANVKPTNSES